MINLKANTSNFSFQVSKWNDFTLQASYYNYYIDHNTFSNHSQYYPDTVQYQNCLVEYNIKYVLALLQEIENRKEFKQISTYLFVWSVLVSLTRLGAHRRIGRVGTEQDFKVVKIISHASYHNPVRYSYDIALIKLEKPANLNKAVGLVCVPDGNSPAMPIDNLSKKCWITGWGRLASGGATPEKLMQASVPLVSNSRYVSFDMISVSDGKTRIEILLLRTDSGRVNRAGGPPIDSSRSTACPNSNWVAIRLIGNFILLCLKCIWIVK